MAQPVGDRRSTGSVRLTKSRVDGLPPPESGHRVYWDDRLVGFGVRVSARGRRSYFIQSRLPNGRQINVTLGAHGQMTCEQARDLATHMLAKSPGRDRSGGRAACCPASRARSLRGADHEGTGRAVPDGARRTEEAPRQHQGRQVAAQDDHPAGPWPEAGGGRDPRRCRATSSGAPSEPLCREPSRGAASQDVLAGRPLVPARRQPLQGRRALPGDQTPALSDAGRAAEARQGTPATKRRSHGFGDRVPVANRMSTRRGVERTLARLRP